jgi:catechol 2,3-dioxygenase-like lactoylglutathione lyase family enzyme
MIGQLHHVAVSVRDMKKAVEFFADILGMERDYTAHHEGYNPSMISGVPGAVLDVCVMKKGAARVELTDYRVKDDAGLGPRRQNDIGVTHMAFVVSGIDGEYERIRSLGYEFFSPPIQGRPGGPRVCYFHGPDNIVVELYEPADFHAE